MPYLDHHETSKQAEDGRRWRLPPALGLIPAVLLFLAVPGAALGQGPEGRELFFAEGFESGTYFGWDRAELGAADGLAPSLELAAPSTTVLFNQNTTQIEVLFADADSGIAPGSLQIWLGTTRLDPSCELGASSAICDSGFLDAGFHELRASVWDQAGNRGELVETLEVVIDTQPPEISLTSPVEGALLNSPTVAVFGLVTDADQVLSVEINGSPATLEDEQLSGLASLTEGDNVLRVEARDRAGNTGSRSLLVTLDVTPPELVLEEPLDGALSNAPSIRFYGRARDTQSGVELTIAASPVPLQEERFESQVALSEGVNGITVEARDEAGNVASRTVQVERLTVPQISIDTPADGSLIMSPSVEVTGTVSSPAASVSVNGLPAALNGNSFTVPDVPLQEGGTILSAVVTLPTGASATAKAKVLRDTTAPRVTIYEPEAGVVTFESAIDVAGLVNDTVVGTVNSGQVTVTVNGTPASVSNRSFLLPSVPLQLGENLLTVTAEDASGNVGTASVTVLHEAPSLPWVRVLSGHHQEGPVGSTLPVPLQVELLDATGNPVSGEPVVFSVLQGNGRLGGGGRSAIVVTDGAGRAETPFTLGSRSGTGNHRVRATAVGYEGNALFLASALPGPPAFVHLDDGGQQQGATSQFLPDALIVVVTDSRFNRLSGVPIRFDVLQGSGSFPDGQPTITVLTDEDGRAAIRYRLGAEEGASNEVVTAQIAGMPDAAPATFVVSSISAGDPAGTRIAGVVLDNTNQPVPGVTVTLRGTSITAQTDESGFFRLTEAPVGTFLLEIDGSSTTLPGTWPHLEFEITTVPGREASLGMPIYLLQLDTARGISVDETTGGILRLPELPGFSLEVAPNSVTFPDGGRSGVVSATLVHGDKVPMVPNFGQQPTFIVTIQPAGARFDPPAKITLPNTDGLEPGEVTELYSFDHDLGSFVSIGTGSVSADGTTIVSDPGVGILKAGWHCGGNPSVTGTPHDCPECAECDGSVCRPLTGPACDHPDRCKVNDRCVDGLCVGDPRRVISVTPFANGERFAEAFVGDTILFTNQVQEEQCPPELISYEWRFGDGVTAVGPTASHSYDEPGLFPHRVTADCDSGCSERAGFGTVRVECPEVVITGKEHELALCPDCTVEIYAQTTPPGVAVEWFIPSGQDLGGQVTVTGAGLTGLVGVNDPAEGGTVPIAVRLQDIEPSCSADSSAETTVFVFVPEPEPLVNLGKWKVRRGEIRAALKAFDPECLLNLVVAPAIIEEIADQFFIREDGHAQCAATDNTPRNAFVHSWLNCYTAAHCGKSLAKEFWDGHENYPTAVCQAAAVDFHNNAKGRDVSVFQDPLLCSGNVLQALFDGELQWKTDPDNNNACPDDVAEDMFNPGDPCYIGPMP